MRAQTSLTSNALMYASVGFQQLCQLQVLSSRETSLTSLELIVYDGSVYAGALYDYSTVKINLI